MALVEKDVTRPNLNIVIVGHVDHGKSTLIGRLLHDTGSLPDGKYDAIARVCEESGKDFEFAFLLDALEEERDQGITIDTAQIRFQTDRRDYVIIDAPGHKEFLKNMITGAASAEAAILLIDAEEGVQEQSRRHGYMLHLLGIRQVTVVINKLDLVDYSYDVFEQVRSEYLSFLRELGVEPLCFIPISAREGDNVIKLSERTPWYDGPTVLESLDLLEARPSKDSSPLRLPVQDVYKFDHRRIIAGRVESGTINEKDTIIFSPSGQTGVVKTIERWKSNQNGVAFAGESIGITLEEQIFVERGEIASHLQNPPRKTSVLHTNLFWLGDRSLAVGRKYVMKLTTQEVECTVSAVGGVINTATLEKVGEGAREVTKNEVATVVFDMKKPVAFDSVGEVVETGRFVVVDGLDVAGGGIIPQLDFPESYQI
ncbi:MAG: GTP-binding protein [Armatimonadota bacterium]|nr:GTP-binding protein [Armatimonadota bacterium]